MAMEAGLYDVRHLIDDPLDLLDHDTMAGHLAATRPCHEPGRASAYHAFTYGWIAGELVRRVTGSTLGAFAQSEIADPLGLDGCFIGTPAAEFHRVAARPVLGPEPGLARGVAKVIDPLTRLVGFSPARIAAAFLPRGGGAVIPTTEFLAAEVPAVNGVFTARSLARRLCGARVGRRRRRCAAVVGRNPPARNRAAAAPPRPGRPDPDALAPRLPPALSVEAHLTIGVRLLRSVRVRRLRRPAPAARRRVRRPARQGTSAPQAGAIDQRRRRQPVITHRPVECGSISVDGDRDQTSGLRHAARTAVNAVSPLLRGLVQQARPPLARGCSTRNECGCVATRRVGSTGSRSVRCRTIPCAVRDVLVVQKGTCCLWYKVPEVGADETAADGAEQTDGTHYCLSCPLPDETLRLPKWRQWLEAEHLHLNPDSVTETSEHVVMACRGTSYGAPALEVSAGSGCTPSLTEGQATRRRFLLVRCSGRHRRPLRLRPRADRR